MLKKFISILLILVLALPICYGFSAINALAEEIIPDELYNIDSRGGEVIRIPDFDLSKRDADIWLSRTTAEFNVSDNGRGYYRIVMLDDNTSKGILSNKTFKLKPNRKYIVSFLAKVNFDRATNEVNVGMYTFDNGAVRLLSNTGIKNKTDGWERIELEFVSDIRGGDCAFSAGFYGFKLNAVQEDAFCIADVAFIELPAEDIKPIAPGQGMIFGGSSGQLGMKVEGTEVTATSAVVTVTGARYTFDKVNNTIVAEQLINKVRKVSSWQSNKSLENLNIVSKSDKEVVLTNSEVTFGVQMDGLMLTATHNSDLELTLTSEIGGVWNRFASGNLICRDDIGGFTVNPDIPAGTGRIARAEVITPNLDFAHISNDSFKTSNEIAGWQIKWTISPGERLGITTFPPREFDWKKSFNITPAHYNSTTSLSNTKTDSEKYGVNIALLWNFYQRAWGMGYSDKYLPHDDKVFKQYIDASKQDGLIPISYMSMNFWRDRNLDEYIKEVIRHKETYGIQGVYSDGVGAQDWVNTYEGMRKLREVFSDGIVYIHNSGKPGGNGGPPIVVPDIFIPAIETYADITLKGEGVKGDDINWPYIKYCASNYNSSNAISILKGDGWKSGENLVAQADQDLLFLEYTGRARVNARGAAFENYNFILKQLEAEWERNGNKPNFYNDYYAPMARNLVRPFVKGKGYTETAAFDEKFDGKDEQTFQNEWYVYSKDRTAVSLDGAEDKFVKISDECVTENAFVAKKIAPLSGPFSFEYKFKSDTVSTGHGLLDSEGNIAVGLTTENGMLKILSGGTSTDLHAVIPDTWYTVKISGDTDTDLYDLYINDTKVLSKKLFNTRVDLISSIIFRTDAQSKGNAYFDNIKLINEI